MPETIREFKPDTRLEDIVNIKERIEKLVLYWLNGVELHGGVTCDDIVCEVLYKILQDPKCDLSRLPKNMIRYRFMDVMREHHIYPRNGKKIKFIPIISDTQHDGVENPEPLKRGYSLPITHIDTTWASEHDIKAFLEQCKGVLTPQEYAVLKIIVENRDEKIRKKHIAEIIGAKQSRMSQLLKSIKGKLVTFGLIDVFYHNG